MENRTNQYHLSANAHGERATVILLFFLLSGKWLAIHLFSNVDDNFCFIVNFSMHTLTVNVAVSRVLVRSFVHSIFMISLNMNNNSFSRMRIGCVCVCSTVFKCFPDILRMCTCM